MATLGEVTQQVVALTAEVSALTTRLAAAEQEAQRGGSKGSGKGGGGDKGSVFDKARLYPKELKDTTNFSSWPTGSSLG